MRKGWETGFADTSWEPKGQIIITAVYSYARSLYKDGRAQLSSTAADKGEQPQIVAWEVQITHNKKLFSSEGSTTLEHMT